MVDNNELDDELENENEERERKPISVSRLTVILLAVVVTLLIALSVTGTLLAVKLFEPDKASATEIPEAGSAAAEGLLPSGASSSSGSLSGEAGNTTGDIAEVEQSDAVEKPALLSEPEVAQEDSKPKKPAIYYPIKPPIIVNFDARGRQRFLQAELALMTRDDEVINAIELHMSMIRNSLLLLIGSHVYEELQTAEGKELLRQQCLQELQRLMQEEIGKPGIEQVLFTNFVMQ